MSLFDTPACWDISMTFINQYYIDTIIYTFNFLITINNETHTDTQGTYDY